MKDAMQDGDKVSFALPASLTASDHAAIRAALLKTDSRVTTAAKSAQRSPSSLGMTRLRRPRPATGICAKVFAE